MFIGAINQKLRLFFAEAATILNNRDIFIGCSGNFTIEQIISRRCPDARIYSNDVSLYSAAIGHALTSRMMRLEVAEPEYAFTSAYFQRGGVERVAVLLLMLEIFKYEKKNSAYSVRMWDAYILGWEKYFNATMERVKKAFASTRVKEYTMIDVHDYFPRDGVSIGFLPTYVGGYEKLFKRLEEVFKWDAPAYSLLTEERREETVRRMASGDFILYDDIKRDDLPCVARVNQFGKKAVYIYSNLPFDRGLFRRKLTERMANYPILGADETITADAVITVAAADNATINHYRNIYLKKGIETASGDVCFLVFAGEKLFGFLIFKGYSKKGERGTVYLLSDFAAVSRRHKRLAKLLLLVSVSADMKRILEERSLSRVNAVLTTAFTDKPVSMKYRGIYDLIKRGDGFLNYRAEFQPHTLTEVIRVWMKKFEKS